MAEASVQSTGEEKAGKSSVSLHYLKGPAFVVLCVDPGSKSQLCDKDLGCLGEEHRGFCTDHLEEIVTTLSTTITNIQARQPLMSMLSWDKS